MVEIEQIEHQARPALVHAGDPSAVDTDLAGSDRLSPRIGYFIQLSERRPGGFCHSFQQTHLCLDQETAWRQDFSHQF